MIILAIDPSGSFNEGKGQTGWVILNNTNLIRFGVIKAKDYKTKYAFWKDHIGLIDDIITEFPNVKIIIENFRLYASKATAQINSELETARLLGYLEMHIHSKEKEIIFQMATEAKTRYTDLVLIDEGHITKDSLGRYYINNVNVSNHIIDALRHALLYNLKQRRNQ